LKRALQSHPAPAVDEVEDVLIHPGEDRPGNEGLRVAIGQTRAGRYLRVIYVADQEPENVLAITAYELSGKPMQEMEA
jgi:hypothetical protein